MNIDLIKEIEISKEIQSLTKKADLLFDALIERLMKNLIYKNSNIRNYCKMCAKNKLMENWFLFNTAKSNNAFTYFANLIYDGIAEGYNKWNKTYN